MLVLPDKYFKVVCWVDKSYMTVCFNYFFEHGNFLNIDILQGSAATCLRRFVWDIQIWLCYKFTAESNSEIFFENWLTFGEVMDMSVVSCFFDSSVEH